MMLIGAAVLREYGAKQPQAMPALRALNALIRQAKWTDSRDLARSCGAAMRRDSNGTILLELHDVGCEMALKINYDLGVVRVIVVRDLQRT